LAANQLEQMNPGSREIAAFAFSESLVSEQAATQDSQQGAGIYACGKATKTCRL
jgi:hypothetical protein